MVSGRFLFATWDGGGNVPPVLALAEQLLARGHRVVAIGSDTLAPRFSTAGVDFVARDPLHEWDQAALATDVAREAATADVVVSDYMVPGALCGAEAAGRPNVALVHTLYAANLDPSGGLGPMHVAATEDGLAALRTGLGLPPVEGFGGLLARADAVLVTSPQELDQPGDRPANVRYVGPLLESAGPDAGWRPPGVDDSRPIVVVGLGTTPMGEVPVLQRLLSALSEAPVRLLVTVGAHVDVDDLELPSNAHVVGHVRHAALLPWASAIVCHGGLGSVLAALAHGLPVVSVPLGREQPHNAAAVERAGAGLTLATDASGDAIRTAVRRATSDLELRASAARLALAIDELIRAAPAVQALEQHL